MIHEHSELLVAEFGHWAVYVHPNQGYLGRCVVWCKRADAITLTAATDAEQYELFRVLHHLERALHRCFRPDLLNFAFLGNELQHLHGHVIPRYKSPRDCMEITFNDDLWGHNYRTNHELVFGEELLQEVKNLLIRALGRRS